jgi:hypothetical protein
MLLSSQFTGTASPNINVFTLSGKLEIVFIAERKKEEIGSETGLSKEKQQKLVKFSQKLRSSQYWRKSVNP